MRVLAIESSCDDTGVAIYCSEKGLISNHLQHQLETHQRYGGVVPELASRDHIQNVLPLIKHALKTANLERKDLDGIAYTAGPGLIGALMCGASVGRSMAYALNVPAIGVHHMEGHLLAPMLEENKPEYPFLALLVSGGHSMLVYVSQFGQYEILGQSIDDAAGEAFDKTAKLLNLPYPGGPEIEKLAKNGRKGIYQFPRPLTQQPGLDFSFSGLKTFTRNTIEQAGNTEQERADIAYAFQEAVVDTMRIKCERAIKQTEAKRLVVAGGVGANQFLRDTFNARFEQKGIKVYYPRFEFCTDNAAMIAYAGCMRLLNDEIAPLTIDVKARWPLSTLSD